MDKAKVVFEKTAVSSARVLKAIKQRVRAIKTMQPYEHEGKTALIERTLRQVGDVSHLLWLKSGRTEDAIRASMAGGKIKKKYLLSRSQENLGSRLQRIGARFGASNLAYRDLVKQVGKQHNVDAWVSPIMRKK